MCHFISWKEIRCPNGEKEILYLTANDVFNTKRGRELQAHTCREDWVGHGAIAFYFEIDPNKGKNLECEDFSDPANFPPVIADAIKAGKFRGLGIAEGLLTLEALAEYERIKQAALAEYGRIEQAALAEDHRVRQAALAEYNRIEQAAFWDLFAIPENRNPSWR